MTRSRLWIILIGVALAGFALGRLSGSLPAVRMSSGADESPLFPAPPHDEPVPLDDIVIELPVEDSVTASSFLDVAGRAKREGGAIVVTLKDASGEVLAADEAAVEGPATEEFGRFALTLKFEAPTSETGTVEFSREDGATPVVRNVRFAGADDPPPTDGVIMKVYFHNGELGPADDCSLVFPVERVVALDGKDASRAVVEALLDGPTLEEKSAGYTTALPDDAALNTVVTAEDGTTTADFASSLERGVAGSCRVGAIRAQIETTLRQFTGTREVVISVDGRIDDALQP